MGNEQLTWPVAGEELNWRKSSRSGAGGSGNCVEIAETGTIVHVRDSKNPDGGVLTFDRQTWAGFIEAIKLDAIV